MLRAISFVAAALAGIANAQTYPVKPVRIISPYPPGGGNDTISGLIADKLTEQFSQRVIVDNRPGANTVVGTEILAKSAPDGYTLIVLPNSLATNPRVSIRIFRTTRCATSHRWHSRAVLSSADDRRASKLSGNHAQATARTRKV